MKLPRSAIFTLLALASTTAVFGQSNLPPQVQADMLKTQIVESIGKGDSQGALKGIADYRALKVPLPPALLFAEAKLAIGQNNYDRAQASLEEYFKAATSTDSNYAEGLKLYPSVKSAADAAAQQTAQKKQADEAAAKAEKVAAAQSRVAGLVDEIKAQMVDIPAGNYQMGGKNLSDEKPIHTVTLRPFRLGKYEVTMAQYDVFATVMDREWPRFSSRSSRRDLPATHVNWDDAQAFAAWLTQQSGLKYRLPSEAEWEYAARAGTTTKYTWGKAFDPALANGLFTNVGDTTAVGSFPANAFGLFDMIGNVDEWNADCYNSSYIGAPTDGSAWTTGDCASRVRRGGSYRSRDPYVAERLSGSTKRRSYTHGFRLAQDL